MMRNYVMVAVVIVVAGSLYARYASLQEQSNLNRTQGQIYLNTQGNEVGISPDEKCLYLVADGRVKCAQKGLSTPVIAVDQHGGTQQEKPSNAGKYIGMFEKEPSRGIPGAGTVTYVYTAE
jgi:hypothetical protein